MSNTFRSDLHKSHFKLTAPIIMSPRPRAGVNTMSVPKKEVEQKLRVAILEARYDDAILCVLYLHGGSSGKMENDKLLEEFNSWLSRCGKPLWSEEDLEISTAILMPKKLISPTKP